jgi:hypothetical protein
MMEKDLPVMPNPSHIIPVLVGNAEVASFLSMGSEVQGDVEPLWTDEQLGLGNQVRDFGLKVLEEEKAMAMIIAATA